MRPVAIAPSVAPRLPMYPPGAPGLGQQFLYGQGPPAIIPQQVIFFLHLHLLYFIFQMILMEGNNSTKLIAVTKISTVTLGLQLFIINYRT